MDCYTYDAIKADIEQFNRENALKLKWFKGFVWGLLAGAATTMISLFITMATSSNPTALDVYRGKTDLEITYRNGEIVDSTVVFKVKK